MKECIFELDHWEWKALEDFIAFKDMHEFISNSHAMDAHIASFNYVAAEPALHQEDAERELREELAARIKASLGHFASQTIISLCTTYEVATKQFFKSLFIANPILMHDFLIEDNQKGCVKLKDVINAGSYEKLIVEIAEKASSAATKGKYLDVLNRGAALCKESIDEVLAENIDLLQTLRNRIVHEKYAPQLDIGDVATAHRDISNAIELMGHWSIQRNVPGDYTYIQRQTMEVLSISCLRVE